MPSRSRSAFNVAKRRAQRLLETSTDRRLRPLTYDDMEPGLHAGLAAFVSAWEAYVESICLEMLDEINRIPHQQMQVLLVVLRQEAVLATEKFNTPNFENSRNLIYRYTGFDPYGHMSASRLGMSVQQTQTRLNEILKLRHAFAHGFAVPNFGWLTRYGVQSRLSKKNVSEAGAIIDALVKSIDTSAATYLRTTFSLTTSW